MARKWKDGAGKQLGLSLALGDNAADGWIEEQDSGKDYQSLPCEVSEQRQT